MSIHAVLNDLGDWKYIVVPDCCMCKKRQAAFRDSEMCIYCHPYRPIPSECKKCGDKFETRSALFRHLREESHRV